MLAVVKIQGCWKIQGDTVIAEVAKMFATSNETKELVESKLPLCKVRVSCQY